MTSTRTIVAALVAALFLAGTASADSIQYTSAPFSADSNNGFSPAVQQFDPSLGTLTGVTVQLNMTITPIIQVINFSAGTVTFNAFTNTTGDDPLGPTTGTHTPATWTDPYGNSGSADYALTVMNGTATAPLFNYFAGTPVGTTPLVSLVTSDHFGDYIGTGTFAVDYTTNGAAYDGGTPLTGGPAAFGVDLEFDGTITVTYDYTTPEPATMGLLGLGLVGLIARRRKHQA